MSEISHIQIGWLVLKQVVFKGKHFIVSCLFSLLLVIVSVFLPSYFFAHSTDSFFLVVDCEELYVKFQLGNLFFLLKNGIGFLMCYIQSLLQVLLCDKMIQIHVTGN